MSDHKEDYGALERYLQNEAGAKSLIEQVKKLDADMKRSLKTILESSKKHDKRVQDEATRPSVFSSFVPLSAWDDCYDDNG